jgi:AraC-like DNA-binding protein
MEIEIESGESYMVKWTTGKEYYVDFTLMLAINQKEYFSDGSSCNLYFRIILIEEGSINITINGINNTLVAPCIICLNDKDTAMPIDQSSYKAKSIYFHPSAINYYFDLENIYTDPEDFRISQSIYQDKNFLIPFLERCNLYKGFINVDAEIAGKVKILSNKIKRELESQPDQFWPCRSRSYFIEILIALEMCFHNMISEEDTIQKNKDDIDIENILEYIYINYSKKITLDSLSKKFNINRTTLNRRFLELAGSTVIAYLINHRLMVANSILKNTSVPIKEISDRTGFNDIANFSRAFKKQYGISPSNFRKNDNLNSILCKSATI